MFLLAAFGAFAQTLMNQSLKLAATSVVMPVDFSKMIWASFLGFILSIGIVSYLKGLMDLFLDV